MQIFDIIFLSCMCFASGIALGIQIGVSLHKDAAIKSGHSRYNEMTGIFEWKEIDKKEDKG